MSLNVLVVDDSAIMRGFIIKTLKSTGLSLGTIRQASNGKEALESVEASWVDLALVDINMPVMDGEEFISRLRSKERGRAIPVIVVSSDNNADRLVRLRAFPHIQVIHKPFEPEVLRDAVVSMLDAVELLILEKQLREMASETLEKMCFLVPNGVQEGLPTLAAAMQVRFTGPHNGRLVLAADAGFYSALASNMLGGQEPEEKQKSDALGEMANVICGNLVSLLGGGRGDFQLGTPEPGSVDRAGGEDGSCRRLEVRLSFDEGFLELALCRDQAAAA